MARAAPSADGCVMWQASDDMPKPTISARIRAPRARGARILAEIVGFGMSSDACHITQPSADGAARAMRAALCDGKLAPEQIGYINAHGTGTQANDPTETSAIRTVF